MKTLPAPAQWLLLAITMFSVGCASTPESSTASSPAATTLPKDRGRITFYRPGGVFGYAQRAEILLDGKQVGRSAPGVKFHVDTIPGTHQVTVPNIMYPSEHALAVLVRPQETTYVRTSIGGAAFGGGTNVELVDTARGAEETAGLKQVDY
jgi:hypothetical protein